MWAAIKDLLLPLLHERFTGARFDDPDPIVIVAFSGPAELGELKVWDDGDEVRVGIGELTHIHITAYESEPYDADLSMEETSKRVAKEVVKFLEDFFAERIVVWVEPPTKVASVGPIEAMPVPTVDGSVVCYSWKGRVDPAAK